MGKLTARKVETAKPGKYGDGGGLQLAVAPTGAKKWVLRFLWQGNAREMGLGSYPEVGLAEAREGDRRAKARAQRRRPDRRAQTGQARPDVRETRRRGRDRTKQGLPKRQTPRAMENNARNLCCAIAREGG